MYYATKSIIASSECTTLKHAVPGKCVLNVLFLVKVTFNQADALKLTQSMVHALALSSAIVWLLVLTGLDLFQSYLH